MSAILTDAVKYSGICAAGQTLFDDGGMKNISFKPRETLVMC